MKTRDALPLDRDFVLSTAERLAAFGPPPWRTDAEVVLGETRRLEAHFESADPGERLLVAETDGGRRLGFIHLESRQDYFTLEEYGHVGILAVAQEAEGKGVGALLMRAAEGWARERGYRLLTLNVFEDNRRARSVYEHLGYRVETLHYVKLLSTTVSQPEQ